MCYEENKRRLRIQDVITSQVALVVKNRLLHPGSKGSPGGGHGNPLQYSCLENSMYGGALQAKIHRVTKSQTQLK